MGKNTCENVLEKFNKRYKIKKLTNLIISILIAFFGITSFIFTEKYLQIPKIFRWLTVNATTFTTISAIVFIIVNIIEIYKSTEMTRSLVYYLRLSSAVAEAVILCVVIASNLPMVPQHLHVFDAYDSLVMHLILPMLGISSFILNDSPIGKTKLYKKMFGTWFITVYTFTIFSLTHSHTIPYKLIPYFFLDYKRIGVIPVLLSILVIYTIGFFMSWFLSYLNRKLSWLWFKGIAR